MKVSWQVLKSFIDQRNISAQYMLIGDYYVIYAIDGNLNLKTEIYKKDPVPVGSDQEDWENNYLPSANKRFTDGDGTPLSRNKMAPAGWHYQMRGVEFETSVLNSLVNNDVDGNDLGDVTVKYFNASDVELTLQADCDTGCVKTQLDYEPAYDWEVLGGWISMTVTTTSDIRIFAIAAPDVPVGLGGSKPMINNVNAKYIKDYDRLAVDGRTAKRMTYDAVYHTGKMRFVFKHPAGEKCKFELVVEQYKQ